MKQIIRKTINQICIFFYSTGKYLLDNPLKKNDKKKNILIIFPLAGIGDCLCSLDLLKQLPNIYSPSQYNLYIAADKKIHAFLKNIQREDVYKYIILDIDDVGTASFSRFKKNLSVLVNVSWFHIICLNRIGPYMKLLLLNLDFMGLFYLDFTSKKNKKISLNSLLNILLTKYKKSMITIVRDETMVIECINILLEKMTNSRNIQISIPFIDTLGKTPNGAKKYCIVSSGISAGHAYPYRGWPAKRFAQVIDFIITYLNFDVYLCGGVSDKNANHNVLKYVKRKDRVFDITGKTNFTEWIEWTRNAEFVFGNDSGYIHLAAAVRTQAFVIVGYWNYGRYHPYTLRELKESDKIPILIQAKQPPCKFCNTYEIMKKNNNACIAKRKCEITIREKGIYQCIDDISVEMAIQIFRQHYRLEDL